MFRLLPKQALKRCIHTTSRPTQSALRNCVGMVAGASAAVTTYVAWRALSEPKIALDSVASSSKPKPTPKAAPAADPVPSQHEQPKAEKSIDAHSGSEPKEDSDLAPPAVAEADAEAHEGQSGAFDPVTGKINWDCPCLGGMAHGPCGMQFREAFSCFVFSEQEPKGIDCVEKFKAMQECFREHPEMYADEIMDDDDDDLDGPPTPHTGNAEPMDSSTSPNHPTIESQPTHSDAPPASSS